MWMEFEYIKHLNKASNQIQTLSSSMKIRQLFLADSALKKLIEEEERQDRLQLDREAREERAEAQKKQILEENSK